jgi:16S rRNA (guanine966-N2)-methyltransferase
LPKSPKTSQPRPPVARNPANRSPKNSKVARSSLRIIGGQWRGRKLSFPCIEGLRPTSDRIRETLFNWLAEDVWQARCMDLCAGSGALGFESVSRGAQFALLLDTHPAVVQQLNEHCQLLQTNQIHVQRQDALSFLNSACDEPFNLVFLDPPFAQDLWQALAAALECGGWLAPQALIYVEAPVNQALMLPSSWQLIKDKKAGQVAYRLYRHQPSTHTHSPASSGDSA